MLEVKRKPAVHSQGSAAAQLQPGNVDDIKNVVDAGESPPKEPKAFTGKIPAITGDCHFKGSMSIDGLLSGQIGTQNGIRLTQRPSSQFTLQAELEGEFHFKDAVRVNGHIAGTVYSKAGTIIVDMEAQVDANVDVAVAVIGGTVRGDIVARERVELGPASKIYGNIWTRSIVIKDGAIFEGVCRMIDDKLHDKSTNLKQMAAGASG
jgi:cytoskeletal protein CcmA (bactofilin family)